MKCPHCGQEHPDNTKLCPETGKKLKPQSWICDNPKCDFRQPLPMSANFCPNCQRKRNASTTKNNEKTVKSNSGQIISPRIIAVTSGPNCYLSGPQKDNCHLREGENIIRLSLHKEIERGFQIGRGEELISIEFVGLNTTGFRWMDGMFSGCSALKSLDLSSFDTSQVTETNWMFAHCSALKSLDLSSFDTSQVTDMQYMFFECSALKSLDLSSFDTSNVTNMEGMFGACSELKSLDLSCFDTSNVTNMEKMFGDCSALKSLDLSCFDTSNVEYFDEMFLGCSSMETLDMSGFSMRSNVCYDGLFEDCTSLKTVILRGCDNFTIDVIEQALENAGILQSVNMIID